MFSSVVNTYCNGPLLSDPAAVLYQYSQLYSGSIYIVQKTVHTFLELHFYFLPHQNELQKQKVTIEENLNDVTEK